MAEDARLVWNGGSVKIAVEREVGKRIDAAARHLKNSLRISVSGKQKTKGTGSKKRGLNPSRPGEYPKMVTAHFRRTIASEYDRRTKTARVGTNLVYGKHLQLGTSRMAARPWLTKGIRDNFNSMRQIIFLGRVL